MVSQGADGYYSVDYGKLTPLLVEAIKEQQQSIEQLTAQVKALQAQLATVRTGTVTD